MPKTASPRKPHGLKGRPSNARKGDVRNARLTIRLPDAVSEQLDTVAERDGVTRSDAAIAALVRGLGVTADPKGPNYLKPAPGYGQGGFESCTCEIIPANPVRERAEFQCSKCQRIYPQSLIEEVDGKYRMKEIVVRRRPRRR